MVPTLRQKFNTNFTPHKYRAFLDGLRAECGAPIKFRNSETPCFYSRRLLEQMAAFGVELIKQLIGNAEYLAASARAIPAQFKVPGETSHPEFIQADFGLVRNAAGNLEPKLVEIQGFPSLYAYQTVLAQQYIRAYGLDERLRFIMGGLNLDEFLILLRRAILGRHAPKNVVLLEIDPQEQKTLPDFLLTERLCGIKTVNVRDVKKDGKRLHYDYDGKSTEIHRIYNRVIMDELSRKNIQLGFDLRDDLEVEWAAHPNWFFHISKFSLPFLKHPCVPPAQFLNEGNPIPADLSKYVLKPLYSFAGTGVIIAPKPEDLAAIPEARKSEFILQERLDFAPVIETPHGPTQAELRIMYIWLDELRPGPVLVRMGRGKMMGVDYNRDLEWVGSSAGMFLDE
jgi:hypothetical protein